MPVLNVASFFRRFRRVSKTGDEFEIEGIPAFEEAADEQIETRAIELLRSKEDSIRRHTDGLFGRLLICEWFVVIALALWVAPVSWAGLDPSIPIHVWWSLTVGGVVCALPLVMVRRYPGSNLTRHVGAIAQILIGTLFIHLTGGRIETHFHIFGSLAFLAFYRDWRVLVTASAVATASHLLGGIYWPQSMYGVDTATAWRTLEHFAWIVFETVFLLIGVHNSRAHMLNSSRRRADLERLNADVESRISVRTSDLQASKERAHAILDTAYDAFVEIDSGGRITEWNPQAAEVFGWSYAEAIGRSLRETIFSAANRGTAQQDVWNVLVTEEGPLPRQRLEFIALRRDGGEFPVEMTMWPVSRGSGWRFNAFIHDISERRRAASEAARARDAALESARMKAEFLANMSHEIRTPMNGVIGMLNLLSDTALGPQQRDFAETARQSAESLLTVLNDILDFSKIEAGHLTVEETDFDLRELLESTLELLAERAQSKGLELMGSIENGTPTALRGDPTRIRQVLLNLTGNAIKFTDKGEVVVLVRAKSNAAGMVMVHFEVRDTGIGISEDALKRLFQPFAQADGSTTRKYGGTGLGLAISRRLVELMNGEIGVSSEEGLGSTFRFFTRIKHAQQLNPAPHRASVARRRVLIVDDNATNRSVLHHQLEAWDVRDGVASGPGEALTLLRDAVADGDPYSLALLDMQMPVMDGLDLARAIKADPAIDATRLVILTSLGARLDEVTRQAAGIDDWLFKPVRQSRLFDCLTRTMAAAGPTNATTMDVAKLPARPAALDSKANAAVSPLRILLAEDNAVNQRVAIGQLRKIGYTADLASNGHEVIALHLKAPYDVILMDCQMPEMEGFEASRRIRDLEAAQSPPPCPRTYIIALTAHALQGDREKCLAAGMDEYLTKPMKVASLGNALAQAAETRSAVSIAAPKG